MREYERIKSIVYGKLIDKTDDRDYTELSEELFGEGNCFNSSEVRKRMYGMRTVIEAIEKDGIDSIGDNDLLTKYEEKEIALKEERVRLNDIRRKLNKVIRENSRYKNNFELLEGCIRELNDLKPLVVKNTNTIQEGNEAVLNFSDFHLGIEINNYFNNYNKDIAKERLELLVKKTIERCKKNNVSKLHFLINGDLINGYKHSQLVADADLSVAESVTKVSEYISEAIYEFAKEIENVEVYFALGNHAMMMGNKECLDRDNFEYIIRDFVKLRVSNCKNVTIHTNKYSDEIVDIRIGDKLIIGTHGHRDKIRDCAKNLSTFLDEKPSQILLGHYHHYEEIDQNNINVKVNGSLVSTDSYAFGLRLNSKPYQVLVIYNKNGEEECTYKIKLTN